MWSRDCANCEFLDTAILDDMGNVRLCWSAEPVGNIANGLTQLSERARSIKDEVNEVNEVRGCSKCDLQRVCAQCVAPFNRCTNTYCERISDGMAQTAQLVRTIDLLREYVG
jgi:radical SAM protein with 4Fe4S-binding SPASM domain